MLSTSHGPCHTSHGLCRCQMRYRARNNTGRINEKMRRSTHGPCHNPHGPCHRQTTQPAVTPVPRRFFSLSLTSISLHSTAPHHMIHTLILHLAEILHTTRTISLGTELLSSHTSSPSLGPYRATSISVPRTTFSFLIFSAINPALPVSNPSLTRSVSHLHGPCHPIQHGPHHILNGPCQSRSHQDLKAHGPCHHPLGPCRHLTEHKMNRKRRTKRNQDRAQAALRAQTPPPDHTPAPSSESSQSAQWSTPSSVRSATPQPAPSPARYDSEESDHYSGHYTDRAAEHEPNFFPMPTRRMFECFKILQNRRCKNTPTIDFDALRAFGIEQDFLSLTGRIGFTPEFWGIATSYTDRVIPYSTASHERCTPNKRQTHGPYSISYGPCQTNLAVNLTVQINS